MGSKQSPSRTYVYCMEQRTSIEDNADLSMGSSNFVQNRVYEPDCKFCCLAKNVEGVEARKEWRRNGGKRAHREKQRFPVCFNKYLVRIDNGKYINGVVLLGNLSIGTSSGPAEAG